MKFYRRAKKLIQLDLGRFYHFFSLYPIHLYSMVLIPSSNLYRASPTAFRASEKARNWHNITLSWIRECIHIQFVCLYGDNFTHYNHTGGEKPLITQKIHSLFSGSAYHNPQILIQPYKRRNLDFFSKAANYTFLWSCFDLF